MSTPEIVFRIKDHPKIRASQRKRKSDIPHYVPGQTCLKQGKQHTFVNKGNYSVCTKCGSGKTHYVSKKVIPMGYFGTAPIHVSAAK